MIKKALPESVLQEIQDIVTKTDYPVDTRRRFNSY